MLQCFSRRGNNHLSIMATEKRPRREDDPIVRVSKEMSKVRVDTAISSTFNPFERCFII